MNKDRLFGRFVCVLVFLDGGGRRDYVEIAVRGSLFVFRFYG